MSGTKKMNRRDFLKASALFTGGALLAACAPQIIEKTVEVPKIVKETVEVERTVEVAKTVKETVEVEKTVEVAQKKPEKLVYWHMFNDDDADKGRVVKDFASTFESSAGIKVELSQIVWTDHLTRMQTVGASKDKTPDIFNSGVARSGLQAMVDGGFVMPLDDLLTPDDLAQYQPALLEAAKFNGKLYGLPIESQIFGFLYNMKVFDDLGLKEPSTLEELEAAMDKMLAANIVPLPLVVGTGTFAADWITQTLAARAATQTDLDAITTGNAKFSDKLMAVEETLERWAKKSYFGLNVLTNEWGPQQAAMHDNKVGMMAMGTFFAAETKTVYKEADLKYGIIVPPPLVSGIPAQIAGGLWWNVSVNQYTAYPEWAARFAVAMSGKGFSEQWVRRTFNPSGGLVDTSQVTFTTLKRAFEIMKDHQTTWFNVPAMISTDYANVQVQLVAGQITAKEAASQIDALFAGL